MAERRYFPVFLDLAGRSCLVVGGGAVAERKVGALLRAEARVTVVSPGLTRRLAGWRSAGRIRHLARPYRRGDLAGHALAFVTTGRAGVGARVAGEGRRLGVLVNAADDPARCDFILPSVLRRGALAVAVGTGGASPALARVVREELEAYLSRDYATLTAVVAAVRRELRARGCSAPGAAWRAAIDGRFRRLVAAGRRAEARRLLRQRLGGAACA